MESGTALFDKLVGISDLCSTYGFDDVVYSVTLAMLVNSHVYVQVDSEDIVPKVARLLETYLHRVQNLKSNVVHFDERSTFIDLSRVMLNKSDQSIKSPVAPTFRASNSRVAPKEFGMSHIRSNSSSVFKRQESGFTRAGSSFGPLSINDFSLNQPTQHSLLAPIKSITSLSPSLSKSVNSLSGSHGTAATSNAKVQKKPTPTCPQAGQSSARPSPGTLSISRTESIGGWIKRIPSLFSHSRSMSKSQGEETPPEKPWSRIPLLRRHPNKPTLGRDEGSIKSASTASPLRGLVGFGNKAQSRSNLSPHYVHQTYHGYKLQEKMPSLLRVFTTLEASANADAKQVGGGEADWDSLPPVLIVSGIEKTNPILQVGLAEYIQQFQYLLSEHCLVLCLVPSNAQNSFAPSLQPRLASLFGVNLVLSGVNVELARHSLDKWACGSSNDRPGSSSPCIPKQEIYSLQSLVKENVYIDFSVRCYIRNIAYALFSCSKINFFNEFLLVDAIERASASFAALLNQSYVSPLEVQAVLYRILPHRTCAGLGAVPIIDEILASLPVPC